MVSPRDGTFQSVTHATVFPARSCSPQKTLEVHPVTPLQALLSPEEPPLPDFCRVSIPRGWDLVLPIFQLCSKSLSVPRLPLIPFFSFYSSLKRPGHWTCRSPVWFSWCRRACSSGL